MRGKNATTPAPAWRAPLSQAVRRTRLRRIPYRGQDKTHLANVLSATALDIIRIGAWLNGSSLGTSRASHLARLTLTA